MLMMMMVLGPFLLVLLLRSIAYAQFNLYDTDRVSEIGMVQFDCFHYYVHSGSVDTRFDNSIKQVIKYCIRPTDEISPSLPNHKTHHNNFTFEQLRYLHVTVQQLLAWSASIDLVERYLLYLNQSVINMSLSNQLFYNCTDPWFGSRCQYSFVQNRNKSFSVIVDNKFRRVKRYGEKDVNLTDLTCYTHLKCNRGGAHVCLDWREVCNGRIDCIDGGADEAECFVLEMNECDESEYRCHNGLCIPKDFWQDDENNPDCLDRSDELNIPSSFDSCFQTPAFRCEEHICIPGEEDFSCGDGQCVLELEPCSNGRDELLSKSLLVKGSLSDKCWKYLACFGLIIHYYDKSLCGSLINSLNKDNSYFLRCKRISQFPTTFALDGHIRFLYQNNQSVVFISQLFIKGRLFGKVDAIPSTSVLDHWHSELLYPNTNGLLFPTSGILGLPSKPALLGLNFDFLKPLDGFEVMSLSVRRNRPNSTFFGPERMNIFGGDVEHVRYFTITLPDFVCYDQNLCDFITPTFYYKNLTCRHRHVLNITEITDYKDFILAMKNYFRGCLTGHKTEHDNLFRLHSSLYCCQNSSKCISKHRLVDGIIDCHMGDDETYEFSCSLNDKFRFQCGDRKNQCFSPIVSLDICHKRHLKDSINEIYFHNLCNGVDDLFPQEIDGEMHTDETECEHWPCDHMHTRCDRIWTCHDGRDEDNCIETECPSRSYPCVSPENHTLICLSFDQINDGVIDCLGVSDEFDHCLRKNYNLNRKDTFQCSDSDKCISASSLCDKTSDCDGDDDENFCENNQNICSENYIGNSSEIERILCHTYNERSDNAYFSLKTSPVYPPSETSDPHPLDESSEEHHQAARNNRYDHDDIHELENFTWIQHCNRGIYVQTLLDGKNDSYKCFCPPSYYGDFCQYQNQRVSLTLRLLPVDRHSVYAILVKLIDENDQINSYEQFIFMANWGCKMKFNINLLYSTRPKNITKTYSVHIDAFDKLTLMHYASWYLSISFPFLPVNRLVAQLAIPVQRTMSIPSCNLTCNNGGQCVKYENTPEFFCQCQSNWSGNLCNTPISCDACSSDSNCVGSANNRSMCVCPSDKAGPRCLLPSSCPLNACKNDGLCVLIDGNIGGNNYMCICSEQYYGLNCEHSKRRLTISFDNIEIPSHMQLFLTTVSNNSQPSNLFMVKKLAHDQTTVSFYTSMSFHMAFVKITDQYYLVAVQQHPRYDISTFMRPTQRCHAVNELFNSTIMTFPLIRRVKHYYLLCQNLTNPRCFFDENYMCLCTREHYPNCFEFDHQTNLTCPHNNYCKNDAMCLQDDPTCPSNTICICSDCYFGTQCQFYAKGFGLTLDDILRYEIRPNLALSQQKISVKISAVIAAFIFLLGAINSICSCLTFKRKNAKQVGCGLYLLASSITSILTVLIFKLKFWFLILSQIGIITNRTILHIGCISIEPSLKIFLSIDTWLNACVAIERAITVFQGVKFHKATSKRLAKRVIFVLPLLIIGTFIHEPIHRELFDDEEERRTWCVTGYSRYFQEYNSAIILFHFLIPFVINLSSALFIIIINAARQRSVLQTEHSYLGHLHKQFAEHKHILISPLALVILSSPRLIISLMSTCIKSSRDPWLYLCGYFISFIPSMLIFVIFVLPSTLYKNEFVESVKSWGSS